MSLKRGPKKKLLSDEQLLEFHRLASLGVPMETIADYLTGMSPSVSERTLWRRISTEKRILALYKNARANYKISIIEAIYKKILDANAPGDRSILIFLAKTVLGYSTQHESNQNQVNILVRKNPIRLKENVV